MKKTFLCLVLVLLALPGFSQAPLQQRIQLETDSGILSQMNEMGIALDEGTFRDQLLTIELAQSQVAQLQQQGIALQVLIPDMTAYYLQRNRGLEKAAVKRRAVAGDWPVPDDFVLGSMGGFLTYDEVLMHLDQMQAKYPHLISAKQPINSQTTHEGYPLYWVRISDQPNENEAEPEVLYTALHHAREPNGMMAVIYYMYYLLEHYDTDANIKDLVDNRELYFVPIVNPDGYLYNQQISPNGGGSWRKNRRNNGGTFGVDLNRNYGYMWGYDNSGSSPYPGEDTYRGTEAFSEPETQMIKAFCEAHEFKIALNYHTYSNLLLYPWGYTADELTDDEAVFNTFAGYMTEENHYTYGPGSTTIYPSNGGSDDWFYGEQSTKEKILAYTPEVGSSDDGFWPAMDRIIPLCQATMLQSLRAAQFAGDFVLTQDQSPDIWSDNTGYIRFSLQHLGLETGGSYTVSVQPLDAHLEAPESKTLQGLETLEKVYDSIPYTINGLQNGQEISYVLTTQNGDVIQKDTLTKVYGHAVVVFEEPGEDLNNWTGNWGLSNSQYVSGPSSITDSPQGNYGNNQNNELILKTPVDLSDAIYALLNFNAKWDIEAGWDYARISVSDNNGASWIPLEGKYTHSGNQNQGGNAPLYDGTQNEWIRESVNLQACLGKEVLFKFVMYSDNYTTGDGFYFDDFYVTVVDNTVGTRPVSLPSSFGLHPNPACETVWVSGLHSGVTHLVLLDATGQQILQKERAGAEERMQMDVSALKAGLYFCCFKQKSRLIATRKLVIQ